MNTETDNQLVVTQNDTNQSNNSSNDNNSNDNNTIPKSSQPPGDLIVIYCYVIFVLEFYLLK